MLLYRLHCATLSNLQYRPCWSAGECDCEFLLARLYFQKSAEMKPNLQITVSVVSLVRGSRTDIRHGSSATEQPESVQWCLLAIEHNYQQYWTTHKFIKAVDNQHVL
jgi:hypothetical protein